MNDAIVELAQDEQERRGGGNPEERVRRLLEGNGALDRETLLDALSRLSPVSYATFRIQVAERLEIGVGFLDRERDARRAKESQTASATTTAVLHSWAVEPARERVETGTLLDEIVFVIRLFVVVTKHQAVAIALWILHAWTIKATEWSPILAIFSPEKQCGKTRLLELMGFLVPRPLQTASMSAAVFYRLIDSHMPTALIDESDSFLAEKEELRGLMNAGRAPDSNVWRSDGDDYEPRAFKVFAPLAIAGIGKLPHDTLRDRSVMIFMQRKRRTERLPRLRRGRQRFAELQRKLARWAMDTFATLHGAEPDLPDELDDRAQDNWRALVAIADLAAGDSAKLARDAAISLSGDGAAETDSIRELLLADLRDLFTELGDKISTATIVERLGTMEERPWSEWAKSRKSITPHGVASLLKPFGIKPKTVRLRDDSTPKGYDLADFEDTFGRYLTPSSPGTPLPETPQRHKACAARVSADFGNATTDPCGGSKNSRKPLGDKGCGGVADLEGGLTREGVSVQGSAADDLEEARGVLADTGAVARNPETLPPNPQESSAQDIETVLDATDIGAADTKAPKRSEKPCLCCGRLAWWASIHGALVCRYCHAPASAAAVKDGQ
jgi:putative DNA primase/helicase